MNKIKKNYLHMKQSSMSKTELAEVIGKKLKEETFGKVLLEEQIIKEIIIKDY